MTRLEVIRENKARYARLMDSIDGMNDLEKRVAETMTTEWIKGNNWMGGISDNKSDKICVMLEKEGFSVEEVDAEFERQMKVFG